jgi:hypothetical protein
MRHNLEGERVNVRLLLMALAFVLGFSGKLIVDMNGHQPLQTQPITAVPAEVAPFNSNIQVRGTETQKYTVQTIGRPSDPQQAPETVTKEVTVSATTTPTVAAIIPSVPATGLTTVGTTTTTVPVSSTPAPVNTGDNPATVAPTS